MTMRTLCAWALATACVGGAGAPAAFAKDDHPAAADAPTPRTSWLVTGHAVGDTASHAIDVVIRPAYWGASHAWWWLEGRVYRAQPPTVRVDMPQPESLAPPEAAPSTE